MEEIERARNYLDRFLATAASVFDALPGVVLIQQVANGRIEYMSKRGAQYLNISLEELRKLDLEDYHKRFFNTAETNEYAPKVLGLLQRNNPYEVISFFEQVMQNSHWLLHATTTKIFYRNEAGMPILFITLSIPLDPEHHLTAKVERLIEENNFLRNHQAAFYSLTKRERIVLKLIAMGKTPEELASDLFISVATARTHRKNIKTKLNIQNNYEFTRFAQAFNLM